MAAIGPGRCPECEGYKKQVDYFRIPESVLFPRRDIYIPPERVTSNGYYYTNDDCRTCKGSGMAIVLLDKLTG